VATPGRAIPTGADRAEPEAAGPLATQDCQLVVERNDLELQFSAAAKPTRERSGERGDECEHGGDTTAGQDKSLCFSKRSEFSVGTGQELTEFRSSHRFDEARLEHCQTEQMPGFRGPLTVLQFVGG